jgi:deoxycytidine triphosphate deaminase
MITGEKTLRQIYPNLDEEQYQPAGIDLTLNELYSFKHNDGIIYGLLKDAKVLPEQIKCQTSNIQVSGMLKNVFRLKPHTAYVGVTTEKIKISKFAGQFYLPRSSLLRAGIDVRTAFGDPGFNGHLSFLLINHTDELFVIEKGARFAQLVDMTADNVDQEYSGDYNEN